MEIPFGIESFRGLVSSNKYNLSPVENGKLPECKVDALAFALALRETRKLSKDASMHDAIYVEQFSRLLPVWTRAYHIDDKVVLGTWITGGVIISTDSFRRLSSLTGWMSSNDLAEIIKSAGFSVPIDIGVLDKSNVAFQASNDMTNVIDRCAVRQKLLESSEELAEVNVFRLPGRSGLESFFNEHVIDIIFNIEKYRAMGIDFPSAIVLHGPPGSGKSFAVERLVEFLNWPSYAIDSNSIGSPYIHETSKKISEIFDKAIDDAPSVVFIDEMESFLSDRWSSLGAGLHHVEEVAEFLRRIPEAIKNRVLVIATTNRIEMVDPAVLRRGRFDHIIEVEMPSREEVLSMIGSSLVNIPKADNLDMERAFDVLTGKALSDVAFFIREATRFAVKKGKAELDQNSIDEALDIFLQDNEKGRRIGFV